MVNRETDISKRIQALRKEYQAGFELTETSVKTDPTEQFSEWFDMALRAKLLEPNAMVIATVGSDARPSARVVLMKSFSNEGIIFYTNYQSRKGQELESNPQVASVFFWPELERQVRIEGVVSKLSHEESRRYFSSRPRGSQLGAAASRQSRIVSKREELEHEHARLDSLYSSSPIPCPEAWGGFLIQPEVFEFWQGKENRLHDRIRYRKVEERWIFERLAP